ncbi:MAG: DUF1015 family protein [Acidimicrobiales bacterium]
MPRFEPFVGIRYRSERFHPDDVIAPPYDVIDGAERAELASRSPYNSVLLELPEDDAPTGRDRYQVATELFTQWQDEGVLVADAQPGFYGYRMIFAGPDGKERTTTGVIGALGLEPRSSGEVLPHEVTTPKAKTDRADLLRAVGANLSPIWGLTPAQGLADLAGEPNGAITAVDAEGVTHELWPITNQARHAQISALVASAPVVIADGHHRYEVAMAHHADSPEPQAVPGSGSGYVMALVVELAPEQLNVSAIHRLLSGLPDDFDLAEAISAFFDLEPSPPPDGEITARMEAAGALALVTPSQAWLMRPRPSTSSAAAADLDSSRLDVALHALPHHEVRYQHGWDRVTATVSARQAQAGVLLRPASVAQVAATASGDVRMPAKTTYFHPKPRTGMVFRSLGPSD